MKCACLADYDCPSCGACPSCEGCDCGALDEDDARADDAEPEELDFELGGES